MLVLEFVTHKLAYDFIIIFEINMSFLNQIKELTSFKVFHSLFVEHQRELTEVLGENVAVMNERRIRFFGFNKKIDSNDVGDQTRFPRLGSLSIFLFHVKFFSN